MKLKDIQDIIATEPNILFNTRQGLVKVADIVDQRLGYSLGMVKKPWVIKVTDVQYIRAKGDTPSHCIGYNTREVPSRVLLNVLTIKGDAPATIKDWTEHMDEISIMIDRFLEKKYA
jgi:hypothetical protein